MDDRIYGLMEAAEDQQQAAERAIQEMGIKLKELEYLCDQIPQVLKKWHNDLDDMVGSATQKTISAEIARLDAPIREAKQAAYIASAAAIIVMMATLVVLWGAIFRG